MHVCTDIWTLNICCITLFLIFLVTDKCSFPVSCGLCSFLASSGYCFFYGHNIFKTTACTWWALSWAQYCANFRSRQGSLAWSVVTEKSAVILPRSFSAMILFVCLFSLCVWVALVYLEVIGQLEGVSSFLLLCGLWRLNSTHQAWQ